MTAEEIIKHDKVSYWREILSGLFDWLIFYPLFGFSLIFPFIAFTKASNFYSNPYLHFIITTGCITGLFLSFIITASLKGLNGRSPGDRLAGLINLNTKNLKPTSFKTSFFYFILNSKPGSVYFQSKKKSLKFLRKYEKYSDCIHIINYRTYKELKMKGLI